MSLLKKYLPDSVILVLILILAYKISYLSENVTDINNFDESVYLSRGVTLTPFLKSHIDGFFYYLWYKFLSFFTISNIELFYLNYKILLVLPGMLLYIFLRVVRSNILIAYISAAIFTLSYANVNVLPLITKFALCLLLTGFIIICLIKDPGNKLLASVFLSAFMLYIRPEFIVTLIMTSVITIFYSFREAKVKNRNRSLRKILPVLSVFVIIFFLNPVSRQRVSEAYTQQYSFEVSQRDTQFDSTHEIAVAPEDWTGHFVLFAEHAVFNSLSTFKNFKEIFPYFIFKDGVSLFGSTLYLTVSVMFLASLFFLFQRIKKMKFGIFSFIFLSFTLPPILSVLIFYPRLHYLIFIFAFLLIYLSYEVSLKINSYYISGNKYIASAAVAGILLIFFVPLRTESGSIHQRECTMLKTVIFLDQLDFDDKVIFFAAHPGYRTYMGNSWEFAEQSSNEESFNKFLSRNNVNLVLADDYLILHPMLRNDLGIYDTLIDSGFVRIEIPGCNSFLLVRNNAMN